jgi:hypothetical protein
MPDTDKETLYTLLDIPQRPLTQYIMIKYTLYNDGEIVSRINYNLNQINEFTLS